MDESVTLPEPPVADGVDAALPLVAYPAKEAVPDGIRPAPRDRDWLGSAPASAGKHCLPLLVANQSGWELLNPRAFTARWTGDRGRDAIVLTADGGPYVGLAHSGFGAGILSFTVPYLFRTPPGWNLLVRGPVNRPKDGVSALEGLVETDWSVASFTMNWQLTRQDAPVTFAEGEPFCAVVPLPRGLLTRFEPELRDLGTDPAMRQGARQFMESRRSEQQARFLAENGFGEPPPFNRRYFRGQLPDGQQADVHETRLRLAEFVDRRELGS